jgi:hypothetical protein
MDICSVCDAPSDVLIKVGELEYCQKCVEQYKPKPLVAKRKAAAPEWFAITPNQLSDASNFARSHWQGANRDSIPDQAFDKSRSSEDINQDGKIPEWAVCLRMEYENPIEHLHPPGKDPGWDIIYYAKMIQVKSTKWPDGVIMMNDSEFEKPFDFILLVISNPPRFKIVGYISKAKFEKLRKPNKKAHFNNNPKDPVQSVPNGELTPFECLKYECVYGEDWNKHWEDGDME